MTLTRIMLVEDEPDISEVAKLALEVIGGLQVQACSSGTQAVAVLGSDASTQLILLDVMMPDLDGPATLQKIRQLPEARDIPVIFMTAKVQKHEVAGYEAMGAIGLISKPFDAMKLPETVIAMWDRHQALNPGEQHE